MLQEMAPRTESNQARSLNLTDKEFSQLYPEPIRQLDSMHWSPMDVIAETARYLTNEKTCKILDIGSGVGKFCLAAAKLEPLSFFYGVEQRENLVHVSRLAKEKLGVDNVEFIHKNFTQINFGDFDAFYFYNSFHENIPGCEHIDETLDYSLDLYHYYSRYLYVQLGHLPAGTRLATYCSWGEEIPEKYVVVESHFHELLKFWKKTA